MNKPMRLMAAGGRSEELGFVLSFYLFLYAFRLPGRRSSMPVKYQLPAVVEDVPLPILIIQVTPMATRFMKKIPMTNILPHSSFVKSVVSSIKQKPDLIIITTHSMLAITLK